MNTLKPKFAALICIISFLVLSNEITYAQQKVVVVPLIGNDSELKPIRPTDLIDTRTAFTNSSSRLTFGTVSSSRAFVLTSLLVAPEAYPSNRAPISIRFCRIVNSSTSCSHSWAVPNDGVTKLDFGIGEIFDLEGQHYLDITNRGGLASNNAAQQIIVQASGYFYNK